MVLSEGARADQRERSRRRWVVLGLLLTLALLLVWWMFLAGDPASPLQRQPAASDPPVAATSPAPLTAQNQAAREAEVVEETPLEVRVEEPTAQGALEEPTPGAEQADGAPDWRRVDVVVRIVDEQGHGIEGATVELHQTPGMTPGGVALIQRHNLELGYSAVTGERGRAEFAQVEDQPYVVQAHKDELNAQPRSIFVREDRVELEIPLLGNRPHTVFVNEKGSGSPVPGATMTVQVLAKKPSGRNNVNAFGSKRTYETTGAGKVTFPAPLGETLMVTVQAEGFETETVYVKGRAPTTSVQLSAARALRIVLDRAGRRPGAELFVGSRHQRSKRRDERVLEFRSIPEGSGRLIVDPGAPYARQLLDFKGTPGVLELTVSEEAGSVRVVATRPHTWPLLVECDGIVVARAEVGHERTQTLVVGRLPPGDYEVSCGNPDLVDDCYWRIGSVSIRAGVEAELSMPASGIPTPREFWAERSQK